MKEEDRVNSIPLSILRCKTDDPYDFDKKSKIIDKIGSDFIQKTSIKERDR